MSTEVQAAVRRSRSLGEIIQGGFETFVRELREPACLVAYGAIALQLTVCISMIFFVDRGIRAFPPPPLSKAQIEATNALLKDFPAAPPPQPPAQVR